MKALTPNSAGFVFPHIVGTGGIGSGMFFSLQGEHTLGRNESRLGTLQPYQDYGKMHIIMHYAAVLQGAHPAGPFRAFPIGRVGDDEVGRQLVQQMQQVGMDTIGVAVSPDERTLFSVCFQYPDASRGNITTDNSASAQLSSDDITRFFRNHPEADQAGIVLAAPEVPVATRITLLEQGRKVGSLNVASVLSSEVEAFEQQGGFALVDVLAVNTDEAQRIAGAEEDTPSDAMAAACVDRLRVVNPNVILLLTDGARGSYCYAHRQLRFTPGLATSVVSTAGAGDAFLAGTLAGMNSGLPWHKEDDDATFGDTPLTTAVELGTLLASLAVTSADTIHATADAATLRAYAQQKNVSFGADFSRLFPPTNASPS